MMRIQGLGHLRNLVQYPSMHAARLILAQARARTKLIASHTCKLHLLEAGGLWQREKCIEHAAFPFMQHR